MKSYYELLGVEATAAAEEIKRRFRQEIARYHPDKVQHLGEELQQVAARRAAELTEAYRVLMDEALRAEHDRTLVPPVTPPAADAVTAAATPGPAATAGGMEAPRADPWPSPGAEPGPAAGPFGTLDRDQFVHRAAVVKLREATVEALDHASELGVAGFDVAFETRPGRGVALFRRSVPPMRVLGRFVRHVEAKTVHETWTAAARVLGHAEIPLCVFLLGAGLAPARELAGAIAEERRRPARHKGPGRLHLVPVDVRDWDALVPTDAPSVVRSILQRLRRP